MPLLCKFNNTYAPLGIDGFFLGALETTEGSVSISSNAFADVATTVIIRQYRTSDPTTIVQEDSTDVPASTQQVVQFPCKAAFFNVAIINQSGGTAATVTQLTTYLTSTHFVDLDVRQLSATVKEDSVLCFGVDGETGLAHVLNTDASGNLIVISSGGGDASLWSEFLALQDVGMNDKGLTNVNGISGGEDKGLPIVADGILNLISNSAVVLSSKTEVILAIPPESSIITPPLPTKTLTYDVSGNLTFEEGEQNISNLLGTTTSRGFTLTQSGGGVITFEDGTTMNSASGGGGGNFSTPSDVTLDMSGNKIINITELGGVGITSEPILVNSDITFNNLGGNYINNVSNIVGNNIGETDPYLQISNLTSIYTPSGTGLQVNVIGGVTFIAGTNLLMSEGTIGGVGQIQFSDTSIQTTAYQNPFLVSLDMNGQSIIRTQEIFGNSDITVTAGFTDTAESSTLSLSNNGYAVAGTYSQLFLKPTGVELNTGDITAETDFKATLDTAGVFSAPKFKVTALEGTEGLDMNTTGIINAIQINSAPATNINIDGIDADSQVVINANTSGIGGTSTLSVAPAGIFLNTLITGTEDTATASFLPQSGTFIAPFVEAQGFQPTGAPFQKGSISAPLVNNVDTITFSDLTGQSTAYTGNDVKSITSTDGSVVITTPSANTVNLSVPTPQGITSNTFFVNDNVNTINDVLPLMGTGDIAIVSAGTFGNATDITWNVAQTGLSGSVAPAPLSFLTTANASRFTVTATQVRIANIKFQLPVFLSGNNCVVDNCDFDSAITIGTNVTGYITLNNCEFGNTPVITVASTFTNILYFINCNFAGATLTLSQASASQVIFNNCAGFTSYPANALYVGINVLSAGTAQMNTDTIKSVTPSGNVKYASQINMDGNNIINVNNISGRTGDPVAFTNGLELQTGGGAFNMRGNTLFNVGTMTQILSGSSTVTTQGSATASRFLQTVTIPSFTGGADATYVYNDLGTLSLKNVTLTTGGTITYPDTTTQNSGLIKGSGTLVAGSYTIADTRVTAGCICVATYAHAPSNKECLGATVTAGVGIVIDSSLASDTSPIFYMYFI